MKTIQRAVYVILLCMVLCITGCSQSQKTDQAAGDEKPAVSSDASNAAGSEVPAASYVQMLDYNKDLTRTLTDDNYRTTYEIFVYSFCDSNGDGIGDLNGIRSKLDYIEDLGFDAIWLTPVHPSMTYHKYDVDDYYAIDPAFGTMEDYEALLKECHERGIRVYMDLVLNQIICTNCPPEQSRTCLIANTSITITSAESLPVAMLLLMVLTGTTRRDSGLKCRI